MGTVTHVPRPWCPPQATADSDTQRVARRPAAAAMHVPPTGGRNRPSPGVWPHTVARRRSTRLSAADPMVWPATSLSRWRAARWCLMVVVCPAPPNLIVQSATALSPRLSTPLASSTSAPAMPCTRHTGSPLPSGSVGTAAAVAPALASTEASRTRSHARPRRCAAGSGGALLRPPLPVVASATAPAPSTSASLQRATPPARRGVRPARAGEAVGSVSSSGDELRSSREAGRALGAAGRPPVALANAHERDARSARSGRSPWRRALWDRREPDVRRATRGPAQLSCDSRDGCVATRRSWSSSSRWSRVEPSRRSLARRARATNSSRSFRLLYWIMSFPIEPSRWAETTARVAPSGATRVRWMRLLSCARAGAARRRPRRAVRAPGRPA
jgi:hypothetical protein